MTIGDAAPRQHRFTPGVAHIVVTVVLLLMCLGLVLATPLVVTLVATQVMAAGANGGGYGPFAGAIAIPLLGGNVVFVVVAVIAIWRLCTSRPAINVAVTGCVLAAMLLLVAVMLIG